MSSSAAAYHSASLISSGASQSYGDGTVNVVDVFSDLAQHLPNVINMGWNLLDLTHHHRYDLARSPHVKDVVARTLAANNLDVSTRKWRIFPVFIRDNEAVGAIKQVLHYERLDHTWEWLEDEI